MTRRFRLTFLLAPFADGLVGWPVGLGLVVAAGFAAVLERGDIVLSP
ncbi:MAG: hypothetical protein AB8I08_18075 [Sandaracinaceae bacterium]